MALFDEYPREIDMRTRKVIHKREQLDHYLKSTNGKANMTTTVYGFRDLKTKGNRCEYNTAIIPHFVMDFDVDQAVRHHNLSAEEAGDKCCKEVKTLSQYLSRKHYQHAIWFTGGGFHVWAKLDKTYVLPPKDLNDLLFSGRIIINKSTHSYSQHLQCKERYLGHPSDTGRLGFRVGSCQRNSTGSLPRYALV